MSDKTTIEAAAQHHGWASNRKGDFITEFRRDGALLTCDWSVAGGLTYVGGQPGAHVSEYAKQFGYAMGYLS